MNVQHTAADNVCSIRQQLKDPNSRHWLRLDALDTKPTLTYIKLYFHDRPKRRDCTVHSHCRQHYLADFPAQ